MSAVKENLNPQRYKNSSEKVKRYEGRTQKFLLPWKKDFPALKCSVLCAENIQQQHNWSWSITCTVLVVCYIFTNTDFFHLVEKKNHRIQKNSFEIFTSP